MLVELVEDVHLTFRRTSCREAVPACTILNGKDVIKDREVVNGAVVIASENLFVISLRVGIEQFDCKVRSADRRKLFCSFVKLLGGQSVNA